MTDSPGNNERPPLRQWKQRQKFYNENPRANRESITLFYESSSEQQSPSLPGSGITVPETPITTEQKYLNCIKAIKYFYSVDQVDALMDGARTLTKIVEGFLKDAQSFPNEEESVGLGKEISSMVQKFIQLKVDNAYNPRQDVEKHITVMVKNILDGVKQYYGNLVKIAEDKLTDSEEEELPNTNTDEIDISRKILKPKNFARTYSSPGKSSHVRHNGTKTEEIIPIVKSAEPVQPRKARTSSTGETTTEEQQDIPDDQDTKHRWTQRSSTVIQADRKSVV